MKLTVFSSDGQDEQRKRFRRTPHLRRRQGPSGRQGSDRRHQRQQPPRHALDENAWRSPRWRQKAMAPKGYRPRPRRIHSLSAVGRWWCRLRTEAARLLEEDQQQGEAPRVQPRAVRPRDRWRNRGHRGLRREGHEDQGDQRSRRPHRAEGQSPARRCAVRRRDRLALRAISSAFHFRKHRSSTPSISRSTRKSSSAARRSTPSSPASTEERTNASRQDPQTRPSHGKVQQALVRARPVHLRSFQVTPTSTQIAEAVEQTFKVTVRRVNTRTIAAKTRRAARAVRASVPTTRRPS